MLYITLTILIIILLVLLITLTILNPHYIINKLNINNFKFRLKKNKESNLYYIQIRILYLWYYVDKYKDEYLLSFYFFDTCLNYPSHHLTNSKRSKILDDRWEIIKYLSDTSSPKDIQNI